MSHEPKPGSKEETTLLGTLGWVGVVIALAFVALVILSQLGPVGEP